MGLFSRKRDKAVKEVVKTILREIAIANPKRLFADGFQQYNPSVLVTRKGLDIFERMAKDDQVKAALEFRKKATLAPGWEIVSPEGKGPDWEVRQFVEDALSSLTVAGLRTATKNESFKTLLTSMDYGYSILEKVYEMDGSKVTLRSLNSISPHYISLKTDRAGNLTYLGQYQEGMTQDKELPIGKFVIHINDMKFGNPYGTAELEAAYRPWLVKDNAYKWFAMFLERKSIPASFALYDPNKIQGQALTNLRKVMANMQASTTGTIPWSGKDSFEMWEPKSGLSGESRLLFDKAMEMFDHHIARAILLPGNIGMGGDQQSGGSYARSKIHFDSFMLVVVDDREHVAGTVNAQIVKPLVDLNYATDVYPEFQFLPDKDDSLAEMLKTWAMLLEKKAVRQDKEDESHIRAVCGMPEISEDRPEEDPEAEPPPDEDEDDPNLMSFTTGGAAINFTAIESRLDEIEAAAIPPIVENLTNIKNKLIKKYGRNRLELSQVNKIDIRGMGIGNIQKILLETLRAAHGYGIESMGKEIHMRAGIFTPPRALAFLSKKMFMVAGILKESILKDTRLLLLDAIKTGESPEETASKLGKMFEKYIGTGDIAKKTADGYEIGSPYHIETIIRTNVTEAFNNARLAKMFEHPDLIAGVEYSAIRDTRTTAQCKKLDGKVFRLDDPDIQRLTPPNHLSCRSLWVPRLIGTPIKETDLITPKQIGEAKELIPAGFGGSGSP